MTEICIPCNNHNSFYFRLKMSLAATILSENRHGMFSIPGCTKTTNMLAAWMPHPSACKCLENCVLIFLLWIENSCFHAGDTLRVHTKILALAWIICDNTIWCIKLRYCRRSWIEFNPRIYILILSFHRLLQVPALRTVPRPKFVHLSCSHYTSLRNLLDLTIPVEQAEVSQLNQVSSFGRHIRKQMLNQRSL
jgi:hypothetical protein